MAYVVSPEAITKENASLVGGKAAHLAELIHAGFPVPEAFFITVEAWNKFLEDNQLVPEIKEILSKTSFDDVASLTESSKRIKEIILSAQMPNEIAEMIVRAYKSLSYRKENVLSILSGSVRSIEPTFVALRSSAVVEDIEKASSAGQYETFLNVRGPENVLLHVQKCWASFFTPRAMYYRKKQGQPELAGMGVIVQRMINSEKSGVTFTVDPAHPVSGVNKIITEAAWGLGETVVQGIVEPDYYVVDKRTGEILEKRIGNKSVMRIRDPKSGVTVQIDVKPAKANAQVLTDLEIVALSAYAKKIEEHYGLPQDIEWAIEKGKIYILQTRAVTVLTKSAETEVQGKVLVRGLGVSPGVGSGHVKIVLDLTELKKVKEGDVLTTTMTSPDFVPAMEKSVAIVTDRGGITSHAAIVSRELGIPCIVGTENATEVLKDGQFVTVDGSHGIVYEGRIAPVEGEKKKTEIRTKVKVKCNIAFPKTAQRAAHADGVGLLRLEHMLTKTGMHPAEYVRVGKSEELTKIIIEGVGQVAEAFKGKPVWVRTLDARTDEYRHMKGAEKEPKEDNPMLGWHGIRRDLDEPELFKAQLNAIKKLHELGHTNVAIMLPFVIDVSEFKRAKQIASELALPKSVQFGIMVETPAAALTIEEFCKEGIDFASFGSNDLTQLVLGVDRNNERLAGLFNEMHPAMKKLFENVIDICKRYGVETSICGELPSNRRDAVEFLIKTGIDSVSVNIDAIDKVREWVAEIERGCYS